MESIANTVEEYPSRENIMKVQKDYTTEDAIVVPEKPCGSHQTLNNKFLLEKTVQMLCMTSQDLQKTGWKPLEDLVAMAKVVWLKGFKI